MKYTCTNMFYFICLNLTFRFRFQDNKNNLPRNRRIGEKTGNGGKKKQDGACKKNGGQYLVPSSSILQIIRLDESQERTKILPAN